MQQISLNLDEQLLEDIDEYLNESVFQNRTSLIDYLLKEHIYKRRLSKYKDILLYLTILFGFALVLVLMAMRW